MRNMKRMIAVAMLAIFATLGAQTAKADGVLLSDRSGILVTDKDTILLSDKSQYDINSLDIVSLGMRIVNGILLSD